MGKKRICFANQIFNSNKEVAVISMFSDNILYEFTEPRTLELEGSRSKRITAGTYTRRELINLVEGKIKMT